MFNSHNSGRGICREIYEMVLKIDAKARSWADSFSFGIMDENYKYQFEQVFTGLGGMTSQESSGNLVIY